MTVLGGVGVIASLILLAVFAPLAFAGPVVAAFAATAAASAGFALASAVLCGMGARRVSLAKRFQAYRGVLTTRFMCPLEELAAQTGRTVKFVRKDVRKMIDAGLFKQGHLDDAQTQAMLTDAVYGQYRASLNGAKQREQQRLAAQAPVALGAHLDGEARAMLQKGEAYIAQIRASNAAIPGAEISAKIDQIEAVVLSIFKRAEEHPEVMGDLDRLMDYYLPTTVTLLDAYEDLDKQPVAGEAIAASKAEIEATLDTLSKAFARLLDSLFTDMTWDVSTDVSVLHTVLAQEGLLEDPFAAKRDSARSL